MAFTASSVTVPASGSAPVLVFQTPDGVPTNLTVIFNGGGCWLLESDTQTPSTGFSLSGGVMFSITGLVGSIYIASADSVSRSISVTASNIA